VQLHGVRAEGDGWTAGGVSVALYRLCSSGWYWGRLLVGGLTAGAVLERPSGSWKINDVIGNWTIFGTSDLQ
jgi:hypothetical protein